MDRNSDSRRVYLSDSELAKRAAPGRLPVKSATATPGRGDAKYTPVGAATPSAIAGQKEHELTRAKPDLVAKRQRDGK